jgi:hypothetical protein
LKAPCALQLLREMGMSVCSFVAHTRGLTCLHARSLVCAGAIARARECAGPSRAMPPPRCQVRGCTIEPDCGLAFDKPQANCVSVTEWCKTQPCIDDIPDLVDLALAVAVRMKVALEVARALQVLHQNGFVHGDLKVRARWRKPSKRRHARLLPPAAARSGACLCGAAV